MAVEIQDVIIATYRSRADVQLLVDEITRTAGLPVNVIATCQKDSASVNRNYGLASAKSPIVLMLDDDITGLPNDWAVRMLGVMRVYPDCVMCSPRLMRPDGQPGIMSGGIRNATEGITEATEKMLPTACIAVRNDGVRYDENFIASGWEDNDIAMQLRHRYPRAKFLVIHDLQVTHLNEMKAQHGRNWDHNQWYYRQKWLPCNAGKSPLPPVWVYWEGQKLPYIELCLKTIRRHCDKLDLRILDRKSSEEHAPLDKLLHPNWRRITHPSIIADAIRVCILKEHGGLWIDADTIMLRSPGQLMDDKPGFLVWNELPPLVANGYVYMPPDSPIPGLWLDKVNANLTQNNIGWCELGEKALTAAVQGIPYDVSRRRLHATLWPLPTWLPVDIRYHVGRFYGTLDFPADYITTHTVGFGLNHSAFMNDAPELVSRALVEIVKGNTLFSRVVALGMEQVA